MLHIINKSPNATDTLASLLRVCDQGAILFIEDGIYNAVANTASAQKLAEITDKFSVYVLAPDAEARGMADKLMTQVSAVDYGGFVDLVAEHPNNQSWL